MTDEQMKKSVGKIVCYTASDGYKFLYLLLKANKLSFRCFDLVVLPLDRSDIQIWTKIVPDWFESFLND
jgi:arsenate reductase-like glutaredoxin family protein